MPANSREPTVGCHAVVLDAGTRLDAGSRASYRIEAYRIPNMW
jgi:hypothetical protein